MIHNNVRMTTEQLLLHQYRRRQLLEMADFATQRDSPERITIEVIAWILFGIIVTFIAVLLAS